MNVHRSQAILKLPIDYVDAEMILCDGQRSSVILLLPSGSSVMEGDAFLEVMRDASTCIVARDAIAALGLPLRPVDEDVPQETRRVVITLRSGTRLEGELRRTGSMMDHLGSARFLELRTADTSWLISKAHLATLQEISC